MYYLECQCRFTGQWDEVESTGPFRELHAAQWAARNMAMQKRTTVRVVDDAGNVCGVAAFGMPTR
jgi:hypothetical protein